MRLIPSNVTIELSTQETLGIIDELAGLAEAEELPTELDKLWYLLTSGQEQPDTPKTMKGKTKRSLNK